MVEHNNNVVEVCPNAVWRDALFLRDPGEDTLDNISNWNTDNVKSFATGTLLPQVQANIVFVGMAVVSLLIFVLWRLIRRCCISCCMRESCQKQREEAEPEKVLSGWGFWLTKGLLLLFAVAALAMLIAGIILAPKKLLVKVWDPVHSFTRYLNDTTNTMEDLSRGLGAVDPIVKNLTDIANNDINLTAIRADVETTKATLDQSSASPILLEGQLTALDDTQASVSTQIDNVQQQLAPSGDLRTNMDTLAASAPAWGVAVSTLASWKMALDNLNKEFSILNEGSSTSPFNPTALDASMKAVDAPAWILTVKTQLAGLDSWLWLQSSGAADELATAATTLQSTVADLKMNKVPAVSSGLQSFTSAWIAALPAITDLLNRINYTQTYVVRLDNKSNDSINRLRNIYNNLTELQRLQPSSFVSNLTALTSDLGLGPIDTLATDLNSLQAALDSVPEDQLNEARAQMEGVRTALEALQEKKPATQAAIDAYKGDNSTEKFASLKASAMGIGNTWEKSQAAEAAVDSASTNTAVAAVQAAMLPPISLGDQLSVLNDTMMEVYANTTIAQLSLNGRLASLASYRRLARSISAVYTEMPTPKSTELTSVSGTVNRIEDLVIEMPKDVRAQVTLANNSVQNAMVQVRKEVIRDIQSFESDKTEVVDTADKMRYRATCALLGLAGLVVLLLIIVVAINCPWGIGCSLFFVLLVAALMFLLAAVAAAGLVVANEGCYQLEDILVEEVGSGKTVHSMLEYYLFGNDSVTVTSALRDADVVDVNTVEVQIVNASNSISANFSAQFTPLGRLDQVFADIRVFTNDTIDNIRALVDKLAAKEVRPYYLNVKSYVCCDVPNYGAKLWVVLTFGGWLMYVSCNLAMAFLARLDQLPQSGCCGCKPLLKSHLRAQVHPEGEQQGDEEKGTKAVVLNPPGDQQMPGPGGNPPPPMPYYSTTPVDPYTGWPVATYPGGPPVGPYLAQPATAPVVPPPQQQQQDRQPQVQPNGPS